MLRICLTRDELMARGPSVRAEVGDRAEMVGLSAVGWGVPRIARASGLSRADVRRYVQATWMRNSTVCSPAPARSAGRITEADLEAVERQIDGTERT